MSEKEPIAEIKKVISDYHYALDASLAGMPAVIAMTRIEGIVDMHWEEGKEKRRRDGK